MRWLPAVAAGAVSAALLVLYNALESPDRPWRAVVVAALALSFVAVGYVGRRWPAIPLAIIAVTAVEVLDAALNDLPSQDPACERFCGISLPVFLMFTLPIAAAFSAAGVVARRLRRG